MKVKLYILSALIVLIGLISVPIDCIDAAKSAFLLCQNVIIPSLFPFFVCSKLLINLGFVSILGRKCGFIMRPLFNVPGSGAFAFCIGILSGYPVGAKAVSELYSKNLCTKSEAERLLAFCNNSGPLFIIGAVGTGLYHSPVIGFFLYAVHVLSALTIGFILKFYKRKDVAFDKEYKNSSIVVASNLSEVLGIAIKDSIISVVIVCGYIMFFSVLIAIINALQIINILSWLLTYFGLAEQGARGLSLGIFELTNGIKALSENLGLLPITGFLLAWSGISVIMQVFGIVGRHRLSMTLFVLAKLLQGIIAFIYTYLLSLFITIPVNLNLTKSSPIISLESSWFISLIYVITAIIIFSLIAIIGHRLRTHKV